MNDRQLVDSAEQILLAKVNAVFETTNGGPRPRFDYSFEVQEVLKGDLRSQGVTLWSIQIPEAEFADRSSRASAYYGMDCGLRVRFDPGKTYLIFPGMPNVSAFREVTGADDPWVQLVRRWVKVAKGRPHKP